MVLGLVGLGTSNDLRGRDIGNLSKLNLGYDCSVDLVVVIRVNELDEVSRLVVNRQTRNNGDSFIGELGKGNMFGNRVI